MVVGAHAYMRIVAVLCLFLMSYCGKKTSPFSPEKSGFGGMNVSVGIAKPSSLCKSLAVEQTVWNRIIFRISAPDMDTILDTTKITVSQLAFIKTFPVIKAGVGRKVEAWTENSTNGKMIHAGAPQIVQIIEGNTAALNVALHAVSGSIYFDFWDIDTRIDTIVVLFCTPADTLKAGGNKASGSRITLALDYIPDELTGCLSVYGIDTGSSPWDTLYNYSQAYVFQADADSSLLVNFQVAPGGVNFNVSLNMPGVTLVQGYMNSDKTLDNAEQGPFFISEIMYDVNDSEYIEIYNPLPQDTTIDTLILEVNDVYRKFFNVTIKADSFFVISRTAMPFADTYHSTQSALDLGTTGEFIALRAKDSTLMDCLYFTGSGNTQEWPVLSTSQRASIVLDSLGGPAYNNYGKHWAAAVTSIPGTGLKGTPRTRGK